MKKENHKLHNGNFIEACHNAVNGIIYATTTQSNIKKQLLIAVMVMIASLFFDLSTTEFLCLVLAVILVIFAEMVNTAIETVVDLYVDVYHPKAKIAKDVAAGGVVITAVNGIIVAYFLFFKKIGMLGTNMLQKVIASPAHLILVAFILTIIGVVAIKAASTTKPNKLLNSNRIPSGQSAIAFAALTAIWLTSSNILIVTLSLILAMLVAMNRVTSKAHSNMEAIYGACMGVLVVLLIYGITLL